MAVCYALIRVRDKMFAKAYDLDQVNGTIKSDQFYENMKKHCIIIKLDTDKKTANIAYKPKKFNPTSENGYLTTFTKYEFDFEKHLTANALKKLASINDPTKEVEPFKVDIYSTSLLEQKTGVM